VLFSFRWRRSPERKPIMLGFPQNASENLV
jgi:hypothetical protein